MLLRLIRQLMMEKEINSTIKNVLPILLNFWLREIMNWLALLQQVGILAFVDILS